jgi:hypothetical protein
MSNYSNTNNTTNNNTNNSYLSLDTKVNPSSNSFNLIEKERAENERPRQQHVVDEIKRGRVRSISTRETIPCDESPLPLPPPPLQQKHSKMKKSNY